MATRTPPDTSRPTQSYSIHVKHAKACIIVIHEVWGLNQYVRHVCKRLSKLGFTAIAPNLYSHNQQLFTPQNIKDAMTVVWKIPLKDRFIANRLDRVLSQKRPPQRVANLLTLLYSRKFRRRMLSDLKSFADYAFTRYGKVAAIGFSMGGGLSFKLAAQCPKLSGCISFCGEAPNPDELRKIDTPMLVICAGHDRFMNSNVPDFVRGTLKQTKELTLKVYGNARHEFFNEMNKHDYDRNATEDAWSAAHTFLKEVFR